MSEKTLPGVSLPRVEEYAAALWSKQEKESEKLPEKPEAEPEKVKIEPVTEENKEDEELKKEIEKVKESAKIAKKPVKAEILVKSENFDQDEEVDLGIGKNFQLK